MDAAPHDVSISGPTLASHALAAQLVDEVSLIVVPVLVGSGLRAFGPGPLQALELVEQRRFGGGGVLLRYRVGR